MDSSFLLTTIAAAIGFVTLLRKLRFVQDTNENDSSSSSSPSSSLTPSSAPPPSSSRIWTHHVFPSFRGEDVRRDFLSHIQMEFQRMGITPFFDNEIKRGESIGPELIRAIRESKIAIILLSRNYASSKWCLDELVEIMKCREESGQTAMAIFYRVDPSDVKKLTGDFGKVFRKTCAGKPKEDIKIWRQALEKVATIAGYHSSNWDNEAAMIKKVATDISNKLNYSTSPSYFNELVGMEAHLKRVESLLCLGSDEVRMIGIWGPPGIGKTTIARVAYYQLSNSFQLSVFMDNIKGKYSRPCSDDYSAKLQLQQQFMSKITNHKDMEISHLGVAQDRLKDKKVLVVLDGVDHSVQLDAMAKETWWFGPGSRIIVTTQDHQIFRAHGINHIYEVNFPPTDEALQIFCMYAFDQKSPKDGFEELAREVTELAGELPLGLRVMGSYFKGRSKQEWTKSLPMLKTSLDPNIRSILKFSYDALDEENKELFLHIACLFNRKEIKKVEEYLAKKFLEVRQRLNFLAEKSLISFDWRSYIGIHSLLEQLGREIVRKEHGQRQFLVDRREICDVLTGDEAGSKSVIGINFDCKGEELEISERAFEGMSNLQFLRVEGFRRSLQLPRGLNYLSHKLRLLDWRHFPMTCLPSIVNFEFVVELIMKESKLEKLWDGIKTLGNLKWMDLSWSVNLKELPDLSTATNLQKLNLSSCSNLIEIPSTIGNATNLEYLDLSNCSSLIEIPSTIGNATNLRKLDLWNCSSLIEIPSSIGNHTNLEELNLSSCSSLTKLPSTIGNLTNLQALMLRSCSSLIEIPSTIGNATNLKYLYLGNCSSLIEIPSSIGNLTNLRKLDLSNCSSLIKIPSTIGNLTILLIKIPSSIGNATNLELLDLRNCSSLIEIPSTIGNATNLHKLNLSNCSSLTELPSSIGNATNLEDLDLSNCSNLVKLPLSIGNLQKLRVLTLGGCSKLEVLPTNINLESLDQLYLYDCSMLKIFPEISTNIRVLTLGGTAIEEVPPSIRSWPRLDLLHMSYFENLKEFPHAFDIITSLHLSDTEIQEVSPWIKRFSRLNRLVLKGCRKLVSLPQIPDSLQYLDAQGCESLERLDCSFHNPQICLIFDKCFKLNQEARDLIIRTPTSRYAVLPGREVPSYFTHRATSGGSLTIKLKERPLPTSMKFKACILLVYKGDHEACDDEKQMGINPLTVTCRESTEYLYPVLREHLYIYEVEAEVTSSELVFEFKVDQNDLWERGECGLVQLS